MRAECAALLALLCVALPAPGLAQDAAPPRVFELSSLTEARRLSLLAVSQGDYTLALALADAMIQGLPRDSFAYLLRATAHLKSGQIRAARPDARRAYRYADTPRQKHEAAQVAALASAQDNRFLTAQLWMRRALQSAQTPGERAAAIRDFRTVQRAARAEVTLGFSLTPSSNVNNGTDSQVSTVEGLPLVGQLSADALALSGLQFTGQAQLRYRLSHDAQQASFATAALSLRRVSLSDEARSLAPDAENSDYASTYAEIGLQHRRAIGASGQVLQFGAALGQSWAAGARDTRVARLSGVFVTPWGDATRLIVSGAAQHQFDDPDGSADVTTRSVGASLRHGFAGGDSISLGLARSAAQSDNLQNHMTATSLSLGYALGKPLGPVTLSARLSGALRHYPDYAVLFPVPGGREDKVLAAELEFGVPPLEYMGFVPTVTLSTERTTSNVSRFETRETSVTLGFRSSF